MATATEVRARRTAKKAAPKPAEEPEALLDEEPEDPTIDDGSAAHLIGYALDDVEDTVNGLWYGDPGSGKTTDVLTAANAGVVILINAEGGAKLRPLRQRGIDTSMIRLYPKPGQKVTYEKLESLYWGIKSELDTHPGSIVAVVWDSLTEIHKALLDDAVAAGYRKAQQQHKDRDEFFVDRQDYGTMSEQMRKLLRRYRDLPCHFLMTALTRRDQDDDGVVTYLPAVTPALQTDVMGFVDVICHTTVRGDGDKAEFQGEFAPVGKFRGKDRFGALPRKLVDPTFERVLQYVRDEVTTDTDPIQQAAIAARKRTDTPESEGTPAEGDS